MCNVAGQKITIQNVKKKGSKRMLIEFHVLKNYPATNLNRDETGAPKTAFFSGQLRGRVSSQCVKRSWRKSQWFEDLDLGIRTRNLPSLVCEELEKRGVDEKYIEATKKKITGFGNKDAKENNDEITSQVIFFSKADIQAVADAVQETITECADLKAFEKISAKQWKEKLGKLPRPVNVDIALFGRMTTDDSFKDVEAAMQVAHAISTNTVNQEADFFTAVDDLNEIYGSDQGSAMMGDIDFNSNCYYQYASLDVDQLRENLLGNENEEEILKRVLPALVQAITFSNPTGKQNSFAGHVVPSLICIEKKEKKVPISYVNAFEKPIRKNYSEDSCKAMIGEMELFEKCYGKMVDERLWFAPKYDGVPENTTKVETLAELLDACIKWI
ncbi:MAG: type I-E CRISPR-associated protein Cas7/Cse4/CasC [Clostridia bacterium]|nr:type I-E CRISPR-associated protein Cas7/Cse4/CasC [Clostridia bacterium]